MMRLPLEGGYEQIRVNICDRKTSGTNKMAKKEETVKSQETAQDYAVIETGGKQYRVEVGDTVVIEKLADAEADKEIVFDKVLAVKAGGSMKIGSPTIDGATVKAKTLRSVKESKIDVFKKKRRKGFSKKIGHRQEKLAVQVTAIG